MAKKTAPKPAAPETKPKVDRGELQQAVAHCLGCDTGQASARIDKLSDTDTEAVTALCTTGGNPSWANQVRHIFAADTNAKRVERITATKTKKAAAATTPKPSN